MTLLFVILIVLASVVLGLIVLIQNPKGGGLAGSFGGFSNQLMGVKQTTDVLEKGTWVFGAIIAALCIASYFFIPTNVTAGGSDPSRFQNLPAGGATQPGSTVPFEQGVTPPATTPADSNNQ